VGSRDPLPTEDQGPNRDLLRIFHHLAESMDGLWVWAWTMSNMLRGLSGIECDGMPWYNEDRDMEGVRRATGLLGEMEGRGGAGMMG
jgi:hypothetical protein